MWMCFHFTHKIPNELFRFRLLVMYQVWTYITPISPESNDLQCTNDTILLFEFLNNKFRNNNEPSVMTDK